MGKISDSFKREVGKNTGKVVSNFLFGDKHSTPVRINTNTSKRAEYAKEKNKLETDRHNRELLNSTINTSQSEINTILNFKIPNEEIEIINALVDLDFYISKKGWSSIIVGGSEDDQGKEKINKLNNKVSDIAFKKFKLALNILEKNFPESVEISNFKKLKTKLNLKQFLFKYWVIVLIASFILTIIILANLE